MDRFRSRQQFQPQGDQPQAIDKLTQGLVAGKKFQTLMGVTGSGKTFTMAQCCQRINGRRWSSSHNKTLAAQLYEEFKELFPQQCGGIFRQLLRLLPARGVHPAAGYLYREGCRAEMMIWIGCGWRPPAIW